MAASWVDPHGVLDFKIEPKRRGDAERLASALVRVAAGDSDFRFRIDARSGESFVLAAGEADLEAKVDTLKSQLGVGFLISAPQVAYRETLAGSVEQDYTHKQQTGGTGQF